MVPWVSLQCVIVVFLIILLYFCFVITMLAAQEKMSFKASTDFSRQRTRTGRNQTITKKLTLSTLCSAEQKHTGLLYVQKDKILFSSFKMAPNVYYFRFLLQLNTNLVDKACLVSSLLQTSHLDHDHVDRWRRSYHHKLNISQDCPSESGRNE